MTAQFSAGARLAAGCLLLAVPAVAGAACNVTAQGVAFGNYDPLGATALDGVGNININCDVATAFVVSLGPGNGTVADRRMNGGAAQLAYNLYKDSTRLIVWGEGLDGSSATGTNVEMPVYGRIPGAQNVPASTYLDSITVTVTF